MTLLPKNKILFGRRPDFEYLENRIRTQGITFVVGQPRIGKSWLVRRFCDNLEEDGRWLFGYEESTAADHALLSSAVAELYRLWLTQASYKDQLKSILARYKGEMVGKAGKAVGQMLSKVINLPVAGIGDAVEMVFQGLKAANEDLKAGGIHIKPVPYDVCRDLVSIVSKISNLPILLVLDAWEQSIDLRNDFGALKKMLGRLYEWPSGMHIIVVVREGPKYAACLELVEELCGSSFACERYSLPQMHLANDSKESRRIVKHIQNKASGAREMEDASILDTMAGNPAVLEAWQKRRPRTSEEMRQIARDAHAFRDRKFKTLLPDLLKSDQELYNLATRVALLPEFTSERRWKALKPLVLNDLPDIALAKLASLGILKSQSPPTFGHTTEYESAQKWFIEDERAKPFTLIIVRSLVSDFSARVRYIDVRDIYFSEALMALYEPVIKIDNESPLCMICVAAATLFGNDIPEEIRDNLYSIWSQSLEDMPDAIVLVAVAMLNTLNAARKEGDLVRRDTLLEQLRDLSQRYPDVPAVRKQLAMGLFNTLYAAGEEGDLARRDALLEQLGDLSERYPDEPAVREHLAMGLFNTLYAAGEEGDLVRRDALLEQLRDLSERYPDEPALRNRLAMGLFNTLNTAGEGGDLACRDALLEQLGDLSERYPHEPALRKRLAMGLYNTLYAAGEEGGPARRNALLEQLGDLSEKYPHEPAVRKQLAMGLFNTLNDAGEEGDLARRDALLEQLGDLSERYPHEPAVRKRLAMGLFNTLNDAGEEGDLARRDALLEQLGDLSDRYPNEPAVRKHLAMGLFNTLNDAGEEGDLARRDALLGQLGDLSVRYPDEPAIREHLVMGLYNTLNDAGEEGDIARRNALLEQLRDLSERYPQEPAVREHLAMGLFNTLNAAGEEGDSARGEALLKELGDLQSRYPDDRKIQKITELIV